MNKFSVVMLGVVATVGALTGCGSDAAIVPQESKESKYLKALDEAGLRDDFAADRQAVKNAENICKELDDGADPEGEEADKIGVEFYCDDYLPKFEVLAVETIPGTFTLISSDIGLGEGGPCSGSGGYSDIQAGLGVVVRNDEGDVLARTSLGSGEKVAAVTCEFEFEVELQEGESGYVFEVGRRGEIAKTWEELVSEGISLSLS